MARARHPAVVIDAAITKHLKILSGVRLLGVRIVERVNHRGPIKRSLQRPVPGRREGQASSLQYRRGNIGDMSQLGANFALGLNSRGPMDHDGVSCATVMRSDLFSPLERSIAGPCPSNRIMR